VARGRLLKNLSDNRARIITNIRNVRDHSFLSPATTWTVIGLTAALVALPVSAHAADTAINLGSASSFAVLAGSAITNTGATDLSGSAGADIGSAPTPSFTGSADVTTTGTKYIAVADIVLTAKADLSTAHEDAARRTPTKTLLPAEHQLGNKTFQAGVYYSKPSLDLDGTLTLDGNHNPAATFVFQTDFALTTISESKIVLINGAQPCNVFWVVGSSATLGTYSTFVGHVLALTSITATTGATIHGQLLAQNGAVTLDANTIENNRCAEPVAKPVEKEKDTPIDVTPPAEQETQSSGETTTPPARTTTAPVEATNLPEQEVESFRTGTNPPVTETESSTSEPSEVQPLTREAWVFGSSSTSTGESGPQNVGVGVGLETTSSNGGLLALAGTAAAAGAGALGFRRMRRNF